MYRYRGGAHFDAAAPDIREDAIAALWSNITRLKIAEFRKSMHICWILFAYGPIVSRNEALPSVVAMVESKRFWA